MALFYVAVGRDNGKNEADIIKCTCFDLYATNVALNARKGRKVCCKGRLTVQRKNAYGGVPSLDVYITLNTIYFLDEENATIAYLKAKTEEKKLVKKKKTKEKTEKKKPELQQKDDDDLLEELDEDKLFDF